jgi:hypothetical protein
MFFLQSIVLLINKKTAADGEQRSSMAEAAATALPLKLSGSGKIGSMLLAGPLIDDASSQNGGYSHGGAPTTTILAGAKAAAAAGGFTLTTLLGTSNGKKNGTVCPLLILMRSFYQDRLDTNIGKRENSKTRLFYNRDIWRW